MCQHPSICYFTVVMNRVHHLAKTLPVNLKDNRKNATCFVVLDYGSNDGLANFIRENFENELLSGKLRYHRVEASFFERSRSRNIAARYCVGDVICNIDADNYTGKDFDAFLAHHFMTDSKIFVSALGHANHSIDTYGKIALRKDDFFIAGGYDESFKGYGYEDYDLVVRLQRQGLRKVMISEECYLQAIHHSRSERIANEWHLKNLKALYTQKINDHTRVMLYLYKNYSLEYGIVIENKTGYRFSLVGNQWQKGTWNESTGQVHLAFADLHCHLDKAGNILCQGNHFLRRETDRDKIEEAVLFNTEIANRYKLHSSSHHQTPNILENANTTKHHLDSHRTEAGHGYGARSGHPYY